MSDKLFTISLKGASQSQPWTVINADSDSQVRDALSDLGVETSDNATTLQLIAEANALYQAVLNVSNPSGRAPAPAPTSPAGSGEPAQESQAEAPAPTRQRGGNSGYGRRKAASGGGRKPKLTYEEASADCVHGERVRRTGTSARGEWVGYFCPAPKGAPDQCQANFIDPESDQEG